MLRRLLLLWLCLTLPSLAWGQVLPGPIGGAGTPTTPNFPPGDCLPQVVTGITATGALICGDVTTAQAPGLVPSGGDVNAAGQVTSTHLSPPLPVDQGGTGLTVGTPGGMLYFSGPTSLASSPEMPQNAPLLGGGLTGPPLPGTRSGTTTQFATVLGPHTVNEALIFDANGNVVASGIPLSGGGGGAVLSVFGRIGAVVAQPGDYTASQVTNAADLMQPNVFPHPAGQSMARLLLPGSLSGTLTLRSAPAAGTSLLILPAGTTDFSATGGPGQVVRQSTVGGPFTVGQLSVTDLGGAATVCTSQSLCPGYQAALGYIAEDVARKSADPALGPSTTLYPTQSAVKTYVDTSLAGKQNTLGFAPEDVANKSTDVALGTSPVLYPSQSAVKSYVDTGLAGKQPAFTWGPGLDFTAGVARVLSTETGFLVPGSTDLPIGAAHQGTMQVLATGELQYTDGAAGGALHTGLLTQRGLGWSVNLASCRTDPNGGKLTIDPSVDEIVCAFDKGTDPTGGPVGVSSFNGRTGAVVPQPGDYTAAQVTNAADLTASNVFTHPSGQRVWSVVLPGLTSGTLTVRAGSAAGTNSTLVLPGGSTDFTATGGASQVVRQSTLGAALTVSRLASTDLSDAATLCTTAGVCNGYQGTLTWGPGLLFTTGTVQVASTQAGFLTNGGGTALVGGATQQGKMQVRATGELEYTDGANPAVVRTGFLLSPAGAAGTLQTAGFGNLVPYAGAVCATPGQFMTGLSGLGVPQCAPPPGVTSIGAAGILQAANGVGGLAAFSGTSCLQPGTFVTGLLATGALQCQPLPTSSAALNSRPLLATASADLPQGVNLGALPSGLVLTSVSGGVAAISIKTNPPGPLVDLASPQELDNKRVNPRFASLPNQASIQIDLSAIEVGYVSELSQATTFVNPTGTGKPGQILRLQVHSTLPQTLLWGSLFTTGAGFPLPTTTSGAGTYDAFWYQYNSGTGSFDLIFNSQLSTLTLPTGVVPGTYDCPQSITIDTTQRVSGIVAGTCGPGGTGTGTAAVGLQGDVQYKDGTGLGADPGNFSYDPITQTLRVVNFQTAPGAGVGMWRDTQGHVLVVSAPAVMTANQSVVWPNRSGTVCIIGDPACGGGGGTGDAAADGTTKGIATFTAADFNSAAGVIALDYTNGQKATGSQPGFLAATDFTAFSAKGDASTNTSTSVDGEVALFSATTGKLLRRATGTGLAKLTAGVQSTVAAPTGTVVGDTDSITLTNKRMTKRVATLTSSATFTCNVDTADQCKMANTQAAGTLTIDLPGGTPVDGDLVLFRLRCQNAQTFSFHAVYVASPNVPFPVTCPADTTKETIMGFVYSGDLTKFELIATN